MHLYHDWIVADMKKERKQWAGEIPWEDDEIPNLGFGDLFRGISRAFFILIYTWKLPVSQAAPEAGYNSVRDFFDTLQV